MEFSGKEGQVLHREQLVAEVHGLIGEWRAELSSIDQLGTPHVDRQALAEVFEQWVLEGLEPGLLGYIILGAEWLFRARLGTSEDINRELLQMEARFCKPKDAVLEPDQAAMLIDAMRPAIERQLKGRRFLVSLGTWAVRRRSQRWQLYALAKQAEATERIPIVPQVARKPGGPIPRPGPAVAGLVVESAASEAGCDAERARDLGRMTSGALLERAVPTGEQNRCRERFDQRLTWVEHQESGAPDPETIRSWLSERFARGYAWLLKRGDLAGFPEGCRREPKKAFDLITDAGIVALIYELPWAADDPPVVPSRKRTTESTG